MYLVHSTKYVERGVTDLYTEDQRLVRHDASSLDQLFYGTKRRKMLAVRHPSFYVRMIVCMGIELGTVLMQTPHLSF